MNVLIKSEKLYQEDMYMLILSRHIGEQIVAGEHGEIRITLLGMDRGQVRIGIVAPSSVPVHRKEIYDRIQKKKQAAKKAA